MGLVGFTKINKHKKFNYTPVFYNPEKEEFQKRVKGLNQKYKKDANADSEKKLQSHIKGYMFKSVYSTEKYSFIKYAVMLGSLALAFLIVMLLLKVLSISGFNFF